MYSCYYEVGSKYSCYCEVSSKTSLAVIVKPAASIAVIAKSSSDVWMNSPCTAIKSVSTVFNIDIITLCKVHL